MRRLENRAMEKSVQNIAGGSRLFVLAAIAIVFVVLAAGCTIPYGLGNQGSSTGQGSGDNGNGNAGGTGITLPNPFQNNNFCADGTPYNQCSNSSTAFCNNGNLEQWPAKCGCPQDSRLDGNQCVPLVHCSDGSIDGNCSHYKPYYCDNGTLVEKATVCSCPQGYDNYSDMCVDQKAIGSSKVFSWKYKSKQYLSTVAFGSDQLATYYSELPRSFTCYGPCPSDWLDQYYKMYITESKEQSYVDQIISSVQENNSDAKLMGLMALVQEIPYDNSVLFSAQGKQKYPYETLLYDTGACGDKSLLGALIAQKLGYGVALFSYDAEKHMALGIKCPMELSSYNSGYCFLETTRTCERLDDNKGTYAGGITLQSDPQVLVMADGSSLQASTVQSDLAETQSYNSGIARLDQLKNLMAMTSDVDTYNTYVKEYNAIVKQVNAYVQCDQ